MFVPETAEASPPCITKIGDVSNLQYTAKNQPGNVYAD